MRKKRPSHGAAGSKGPEVRRLTSVGEAELNLLRDPPNQVYSSGDEEGPDKDEEAAVFAAELEETMSRAGSEWSGLAWFGDSPSEVDLREYELRKVSGFTFARPRRIVHRAKEVAHHGRDKASAFVDRRVQRTAEATSNLNERRQAALAVIRRAAREKKRKLANRAAHARSKVAGISVRDTARVRAKDTAAAVQKSVSPETKDPARSRPILDKLPGRRRKETTPTANTVGSVSTSVSSRHAASANAAHSPLSTGSLPTSPPSLPLSLDTATPVGRMGGASDPDEPAPSPPQMIEVAARPVNSSDHTPDSLLNKTHMRLNAASVELLDESFIDESEWRIVDAVHVAASDDPAAAAGVGGSAGAADGAAVNAEDEGAAADTPTVGGQSSGDGSAGLDPVAAAIAASSCVLPRHRWEQPPDAPPVRGPNYFEDGKKIPALGGPSCTLFAVQVIRSSPAPCSLPARSYPACARHPSPRACAALAGHRGG